ncbi:hypothetical protein M427DRAFT_72589 [Gonapodya prolifera JEL478]|uniref:Chitin-binding type-1 domain-containing protein n=1 Tax=Gonapodya prolifera (strain JEL478) TaxID=1344416 RepID=A0A139A636_GONPJ|nr:hypothetical protein M427DRAFT_72589 [Gonapodya prolifera JEL478]|eukprot:KXS11843.1 hypothetical protein M427DRAFT_72589 [Gonapodya prolifera JEL478]
MRKRRLPGWTLAGLVLGMAAAMVRTGVRGQTLPLSVDGTCGMAAGTMCAAPSCCSQFGFCGANATYCGTGCQTGFGLCAPAGTPGVLAQSTDGTCGAGVQKSCPAGLCCSQFGFCGTSDLHGCQTGFGTCTGGGGGAGAGAGAGAGGGGAGRTTQPPPGATSAAAGGGGAAATSTAGGGGAMAPTTTAAMMGTPATTAGASSLNSAATSALPLRSTFMSLSMTTAGTGNVNPASAPSPFGPVSTTMSAALDPNAANNNAVVAAPPPVGLIAGGVVGGVTLLVLLAVGFAYMQWRKRRAEALQNVPYSEYLDTSSGGPPGAKFKLRPPESTILASPTASIRLQRRKSTFLDPVPAIIESGVTPGGATPASAYPRTPGGGIRPISFLDPIPAMSPMMDTPGTSAYPQSATGFGGGRSGVMSPAYPSPMPRRPSQPPNSARGIGGGGGGGGGGAGGRKLTFVGVPPSQSSGSSGVEAPPDSQRQMFRGAFGIGGGGQTPTSSELGSARLGGGGGGGSGSSPGGSSQLFRLPRKNSGPGPSSLRNGVSAPRTPDSFTAVIPQTFAGVMVADDDDRPLSARGGGGAGSRQRRTSGERERRRDRSRSRDGRRNSSVGAPPLRIAQR